MVRFLATRFFAPFSILVGTSLFSAPALGAPASTSHQDALPTGSPLIEHDPVECVVEMRHPLFRATVETPEGLHAVKLYFHALDFNDFYYVEMIDRGGGAYDASLPMPLPETVSFVYYIEAVDLLFNTSRTEEYVTAVTSSDDCDSEEGPPPIVVGSTTPGNPAIPTGFAATGIERFISSTGATTSVGGGGIGALGVAAIGGGVAAGVTAGVLGGGDDASPNPAPPTAPPDPSPPDGGPSPAPEPEGTDPVACFHTTPDPPIVDINEPVRFDGSCSTADEPLQFAQLADTIATYHWEFNDGKPDKEGRVVNHAYARGGTFPANLTVTDSAGNTDEFTVDVIVRGDATPPGGGGGGPGGPGPPTGADLGLSGGLAIGQFTVTVSNAGPLPANNVVLELDCGTSPMNTSGFFNCAPGGASTSKTCTLPSIAVGANHSVTATVASGSSCQARVTSDTPDPNASNNTRSGTVPQRSPDLIPSNLDTSFLSRLEVPPGDGTVRGQVLLNGASLQETNNSVPFRHQVQGQEGRNTVEARWVAGTGEGRWVFNFANGAHFVSGSLEVESGMVIVREASRIVFRASPSAPPIRFRYRLAD